MQYHILKVETHEGHFLYDRDEDQPVQVYDWERHGWVEATGEKYQPRFRVPFCVEKLNFEHALHHALDAREEVALPIMKSAEGYMLILAAYTTPLEGGFRVGFAISPIPFKGQKVQTGQGST